MKSNVIEFRRSVRGRSLSRATASLLGGMGLAALGALGLGGCGDDAEAVDSATAAGEGGEENEATGGKASGSGGTQASGGSTGKGGTTSDAGAAGAGEELDGQQIFRHDTFGSEQFWTDQLRLHEFIAESLDPVTALAVGLKVDADVLPAGILDEVDLEAPATTVALLGMGAVVGVEGTVDEEGNLLSVGITCALCHSDVDDSVMEGIGSRLDGHANRDLDPGLIVSLAPALAEDQETRDIYASWGPGYFDARYNQDGISAPDLIPPIYGLEGVELETYTGDGPISYWNAYVAVTQMGGQGSFEDPRIGVAIDMQPDLVTPKLPALLEYQLSLEAPTPAAGSFSAAAAARGQDLFEGAAQCSSCHMGPAMTDAAEDMLHDPEETGVDPTSAERSATGMYRTTPLRALADHPPYFHDGSAETLADVVEHYDAELSLGLSDDEKADLEEYLKSL